MQEYYNNSFLGRIISDFRYKNGVTLVKLSEGVCSASFLSRIESGTKKPGKLLLECLFQRLKLSLSEMTFFLGPKDYDDYKSRKAIVEAYSSGNSILFSKLLKEYEQIEDDMSALEKQFLYLSKYHLKI